MATGDPTVPLKGNELYIYFMYLNNGTIPSVSSNHVVKSATWSSNAYYISIDSGYASSESPLTASAPGYRSVSISFTSSDTKKYAYMYPDDFYGWTDEAPTGTNPSTVWTAKEDINSGDYLYSQINALPNPTYNIDTIVDGKISTIIHIESCLTGDTLVTMSNRSIKRLDEIVVGDKVLCINPETGELAEDEIIYTDKDKLKSDIKYDVWTFSDGHEVKTVRRHRFYNIEDSSFVYMDRWRIGDHTIDQKGNQLALLSHKTINEPIRHYKITTSKYHNYFANGMLTGSRLTRPIIYDDLKLGEK